ncbi:hypothetical protein NC651_018497 [Populus alba x Populus x berolinensis]|nr:hypothetical protein NC651_018497 [Populus alba x Populus x berolinensis]
MEVGIDQAAAPLVSKRFFQRNENAVTNKEFNRSLVSHDPPTSREQERERKEKEEEHLKIS